MSDDVRVTAPSGSGIAIYPPGATFGPRVMREFEFVWLIEGNAQYRRGDVSTSAPAGSIVLCRPGATDFFTWDQSRRTRHAYFHFDVLSVPSDWLSQDQWPVVYQPPEDDILRPLFRHLVARPGHKLTPPQARLVIAVMLAAFVGGDTAAGGLAPFVWPEPVELAWNFLHNTLEERPDARISLADLADAAFVTAEHLCRLFQTIVGHSPMKTVRLARLDRAATLLIRSNSSVGEIADFCGFATQFHFARLFKEAYGLTPRELRAAVRAGQTPPLPRLLRHTPLDL